MRLPKGSLLSLGAILVLLCTLLLAACGDNSTSTPGTANGTTANQTQVTGSEMAENQVLRLLSLNTPRSLDPVSIDFQRTIADGLAEPLFQLNDDGTIRPILAKTWKNIEPTVWEIELQAGVKFWSGATMDAEAVKAAFERHQKLNARAKAVLNGVEFSVTGPLTIRFKTPKPDTAFIFRIAGLAVHNAAVADQIGDRYNKEPDLTGFMKPTKFLPGELLVAEANPNYWGEKPKLQRIEDRIGTDAQARLLALKSGDAEADMNVEVDQRISYVKEPDKFNVFMPLGTTRNLWLNLKKVPALQDIKVRQALNLAVDRKELIDGLNRGYAVASTGHYPAGLPYAIETGLPTVDLAKAGALLDEAGWKLGSDGVRAKDGQKLQFKMLTYTVFQPLAIALQSQWKKVGVAIELNPVETTASNQLMLDGNFEIATYCSCGSATGDIIGQLRSFYRSGVSTNYGGYSNPTVDSLIDQGLTEFDTAKQTALARQIQQIVKDDVTLIYLYNSTQWGRVYSSKVRGVDKNLAYNILPSMYIAK